MPHGLALHGIADRLSDAPTWTLALAAVFAPLVVWLLWRLQVWGVEVLRWRLLRLLRHAKWVYNTVSWFGTFLHEMSHATVLVLSGHGIKQFRVRTDSGHVLPRRMRKGPVGFLFFLVAALAPLFGPPLLALVGLALLVDPGLVPWADAGQGIGPAAGVLEAILVEFPVRLLRAVAHLDMSQGWHVAALAVIMLGIPGSKPSHVKGSKFHGDDDEGDIAVVRKKIRKNPWPLLVLLVLIIAAYFPLTKWAPKAYWYPFEAIWAVAIAAILLSLAGALWWSIVGWNAAAKAWVAWIPPVALIGLQLIGHRADWDVMPINGVSFGAYALLSLALVLLVPRRQSLRRLGI